MFAARKEFELLKLLALDPKTLRTARRADVWGMPGNSSPNLKLARRDRLRVRQPVAATLQST